MDIGGLRFDTAGTFNTTPVAGGTQYDTAQPSNVGLVPAGVAAFKPLLKLSGGGIITDAGAAPTFVSTGVLDGLSPAGPVTLAVAKQSFTIAQVAPGGAGAALNRPARSPSRPSRSPRTACGSRCGPGRPTRPSRP